MNLKSKLSRFAKTSFVAAALTAGLMAPVQAATELNLAILAGIADEDYDGAQVFKNYVETASNGSVTVKLFAGAQLCGSAAECFESMKAGVVDIYNGTAGGASVLWKPIQALDIPYLFTSDRVVQEVLQGPLEQDIRGRIMKATQGKIMLMSIGQTGGCVRPQNSGIIGPSAQDFLQKFRADYYIGSVGAIDSDGTLLDFDFNEVAVMRIMMANSKHVFVAADHTKFFATASAELGSTADIDALFCDEPPSQPLLSLLAQQQVEVVC